jgi:hypothetical protein
MSTPGAEAEFRRWLVMKLTLTRWPVQKDEPIEKLAERLLVHPEALRLAQAELDSQNQAVGRRAKPLGRVGYREDIRRRIDMTVPKQVHAAVHGYCKLRSINPGTMIRSLLHQMLLEDKDPEFPGWWLDGKCYRIQVHTRPRQPVLKTEVTAGAHRALVARANDAGTDVTTLARGVVLEALHGKRVRFEILTRVGQMWDDETRYVLRARR